MKRTTRILCLAASLAAVAAPAAQADAGYNFDNKLQVIPYLSHGIDVSGDAAYVRHFEGTSWGDYLAATRTPRDEAPIRADDFAPPRNVIVTQAAPPNGIDWDDVAVGAGAAGALGLMLLMLVVARNRQRLAHS